MKKMITLLILTFIIIGCTTTTGWNRKEDAYFNTIGSVSVKATYVNAFLIIGKKPSKRRIEIEKKLLQQAKNKFGINAEIVNINFDSEFLPILFPFITIDSTTSYADVVDFVADERLRIEKAAIEEQKRREEDNKKEESKMFFLKASEEDNIDALDLYVTKYYDTEYFIPEVFDRIGDRIRTNSSKVHNTDNEEIDFSNPFSFKNGDIYIVDEIEITQWLDHSFIAELNVNGKKIKLHIFVTENIDKIKDKILKPLLIFEKTSQFTNIYNTIIILPSFKLAYFNET